MCGICGKLNRDLEAPVSPSLLKSMADSIIHRGPDDAGYYASGPVGLSFRRLSIIDLSTGHQPLTNEDGTVWIVFNGEIYNYQSLREQLISKGHTFKTRTDTEVIVHLYEELGERCVEQLRGMFAFAIWDERRHSLLLARDRVGIKPLYYYSDERSIVFGSEIKSIVTDPDVAAIVNSDSIDRFLLFNYLPGPDTLLKGIHKVPPGSYLLATPGSIRIEQYWDLHFEETPRTLRQAEEELLDLLEQSVQLHMISDVPVGFLLSGGLDSTAMLSFAADVTDRRLSSFTVGFSDATVPDERPFARLAASRFGTDHHEISISPEDFREFLPEYVWHMEEPVCEPPAIALYYVSKLAKNHVKVLISGEGGDEAFAGYPNYRTMLYLERIKAMLGPLSTGASLITETINRIVKSPSISKYAPLLKVPFESYYYSRTSGPSRFFSQHRDDFYTSQYAASAHRESSLSILQHYMQQAPNDDFINRMLYIDTKTWLPDDLLIKADKMTMANSIELRVPLLDHKVLEFAASLPGNFKMRGLTTKYLAKKALVKHVPSEIAQRRKAGFPVPYASWFRTVLRDWLQDLLLHPQAFTRDYFRKSAVEKLLSDNDQHGEHAKEIFSLAVLELWHQRFLTQRSFAPETPQAEIVLRNTPALK